MDEIPERWQVTPDDRLSREEGEERQQMRRASRWSAIARDAIATLYGADDDGNFL